MPPLQVGGVHDAVTEPPPIAGELTVPTLPKTLLEVPATLTDVGVLALQVSGTPVNVRFSVSFTVAFRTVVVPVATAKVVLGELLAGVTWMDSTGQVVKGTAGLFTPPALATIAAAPGLPAVATSRLKHCPLIPCRHWGEFRGPGPRLTAVEAPVWPGKATLCQMNGPTVDVMSLAPAGPPN